MFKKLGIGFGVAIAIAAIVVCAIPLKTVSYTANVPYEDVETYYENESYTDRECAYRDYNVEGGYVIDSWKTDWASPYRLFDADGNPITLGTLNFYITNYEDKLGSFPIRINFLDADKSYLGALVYRTMPVGPGETEYGYISYSFLWESGYGGAHYFNVELIAPQIEACENVTKYRDVEKQRNVTKYREETRYKDVTILEYLTSY